MNRASRTAPRPAPRRVPWDVIGIALIALALVLLPPVLRALFDRAAVSYLSLATNAASLAILALSWDILGRTGQLSLAHAAVFGAGAYTTALLARHAEGAPLWLGMPLGALVAVVLSLGLGVVTLRLRGIYFAIATLAFTEVLKAAVQQLPVRIAGGSAGMNVPPLFRPVFVPDQMERWEIAFLRNGGYFRLYALLLVITLIVSAVLQRSRLRAAFTAVRTQEDVAAVMGVRPERVKLLAFALSSALVGALGALAAHRVGSVLPDGSFAVHTTVLALVTPIFGGLYTTFGPVLGAGVLAALEETLRRGLEDGYLLGYGVVLVLSVLFLPRGLVGLLRGLAGRRAPPSGPAAGPDPDPAPREEAGR